MNLEEFLKEHGFTSAIRGYWSGRGYSVFVSSISEIRDNVDYKVLLVGSESDILQYLKKRL